MDIEKPVGLFAATLLTFALGGCGGSDSEPRAKDVPDAHSKDDPLPQAQPKVAVLKLKSGSDVKLVGMGPIFFTKEKPALQLKYETQLKIDDIPTLRDEALEVWEHFRPDVEKRGYETALLTAVEAKKGGVVYTQRAFNFPFRKAETGWQLLDKKDKQEGK